MVQYTAFWLRSNLECVSRKSLLFYLERVLMSLIGSSLTAGDAASGKAPAAMTSDVCAYQQSG